MTHCSLLLLQSLHNCLNLKYETQNFYVVSVVLVVTIIVTDDDDDDHGLYFSKF